MKLDSIAKIVQGIHDLVMTVLKIFKVDGKLPAYDFDKEEIDTLKGNLQDIYDGVKELGE